MNVWHWLTGPYITSRLSVGFWGFGTFVIGLKVLVRSFS